MENQHDSGFTRTQRFDTEGPLEIDVALAAGQVTVAVGTREGDTEDNEAIVLVTADSSASAASPWGNAGPAAAIMDWVNDFLGQHVPADPTAAVEETRIEKDGNRLVVHAPKSMPHRGAPLAISVTAPAGSHVRVGTQSANMSVTGTPGRVDLSSQSGDIKLDAADGAATVRTASGQVRLGPVRQGLHLRSSSGAVEVTSLAGSGTLATSSGDVWVGELSGGITTRSSSGNLTVADAVEGSLEAITGSGDIRVGVREGVAAEVELSSGGGRVSSELDVADSPPEGPVALSVRAGTGSGDVAVTRANTTAAA